MDSVLDLKSKEEKDAELDKKIEALRKKNEALVRRHQMIEEDRKRAEQEGIAVTTPRKAKHLDGEPDKARKEKENFSITLDVSAGEKRVVNDGKSPRVLNTPPSAETSPRSPTHRTGGRIGAFSGGRIPHMDQQGESFQVDIDDTHPKERPIRGRRGQGPDVSRRSPQVPKDGFPGEPWSPSPKGAERGGRGPGRGSSTPSRGGSFSAVGEGVPGPDRKVKEWEEKRKLNIEKMNEEMEKIADYERSQRDGVRDKNPIRNFLDDPRRTGPIMEADRKEGSRRHIRNWGGPDFERVKTGMDREKESHVRRPGMKNQMDMTISMTGKERAEYMRWKQEREKIDQERLARHRKPTGQWKREWDAEKTDTMFKEGSAPHIEDEPTSRRDQGKRGAPKPPTMAEFLADSLKRPSQRTDQKRGRGRNKPYSMHDSRWEEEEEEEEVAVEKDKPLPVEEKETCVEKAEEQKAKEMLKNTSEVSAAVLDKKRVEVKNVPEDNCEDDSDEGEDDEGEWTDASGAEDDSSEVDEDLPNKELTKASLATLHEERLPQQVEALKLAIPSPNASSDEGVVQTKPTSPFSPEGHRPVTDWGEEMEMLSPPGSSNEDSPPQAINMRVFSVDTRSQENYSPSGSSQNPTLDPVQDLTPNMEAESLQSTQTKTDQTHKSAEVESVDAPPHPVGGDQESGANKAESVSEEPVGEMISPVSEETPQAPAEESSPVTEELEGAEKSVHIEDYETNTEVPPSS
ncbi:coiled-coil domain-containing protein 9 isoform X3 [Pseudophryne corroboree]|uniref:coiled-coil domain-containing protein 9 isoform X3 n=1 Tax=Pseudophryne corroboree TaxID=495146 RepID=UPI0030813F7C